jgi:hypothetical protein
LNDESFSETSIVVREITEESISGTLASNPGMQVVIPLDDITRVETPQFSIAKTTVTGSARH